jgi:hypothetical protein
VLSDLRALLLGLGFRCHLANLFYGVRGQRV